MTSEKLLVNVEREKKKALKTLNFRLLEEICLLPEFQKLPYAQKNFHFMTSSKISMYEDCPLAYRYKYVDMIPDPTEDADYFVIGRAFDVLMTSGEQAFNEQFEVVARKDQKAKDAIAGTGKDLINQTEFKKILQMRHEFLEQELYNHKPVKRVFFWAYAGFVIKVELDDFEEAKHVINDLKTCENVLTVDPGFHAQQFSLYHLVVEENLQIRCTVRAEFVDKYTHFSRSRPVEYTQPTLLSKRPRLLDLLDRLKRDHEQDFFARTRDQKTAYSMFCYGYEGYGRPTAYELY